MSCSPYRQRKSPLDKTSHRTCRLRLIKDDGQAIERICEYCSDWMCTGTIATEETRKLNAFDQLTKTTAITLSRRPFIVAALFSGLALGAAQMLGGHARPGCEGVTIA